MKKILSLVLVLSMVLGSFGFAFAAPATSDIAGHKYESAILRLNDLGIVKGDNRGFAPNDNITRAEFATLVVRALGLESAANLAMGATQFTDVTANQAWASGAINVATRLGLVNGYGNGLFGPADNIKYEDAITLIVRALGYEPMAQQRGGYPVGHLVVAQQTLKLTDGINDGVAGVPAARGIVFKLLDNALTKDMMVQVGFGTETKFEVKEGETILKKLGYNTASNKRMTGYDADEMEITLVDVNKALVVPEGFDFEANLGLRLTVWYNDDNEVVTFEVKDTPKFDAVKKDGSKLQLRDENKKYDINADAVLLLNGSEAELDDFATTVDYAKVVFNSRNEVVYVNAYTWEDFMVVKEVKDDIVYGFGPELDVEDFIIVKEGRTISVEDLKKNDILFFNATAKYAEVFNKSVSAKMDEVYTDSFELANGKKFDYAVAYATTAVQYINSSNKTANFTATIADEMLDAKGTVQVFVNRDGKAVFVVGDRGEAKTDSVFGLLVRDSFRTTTRGVDKYSIDVITSGGERIDYDVKGDVEVVGFGLNADVEAAFNDDVLVAAKGANVVLLKITTNESGDVTKIERLTTAPVAGNIATDAKFIGGYRVASSVPVFITENWDPTQAYHNKDNAVEVIKLADADFDEMSSVRYNRSGNDVKYVIADGTSREDDSKDYVAVITDVRTVSGVTGQYRVTFKVNNESRTLYTVKNFGAIAKNTVGTLTVDENAKEITAFVVNDTRQVNNQVITAISTANRKITVNGTEYELLSDAVIYTVNASGTISSSTISLRDLKVGDTVQIFSEIDGAATLAKVVLRTAQAGAVAPAPVVNATITAEFAAGDITITVENVNNAYAVRVYDVDSGAAIGGFRVLDANGEATVSSASNPVFVTVKVYDNTNRLLSEKVVRVTE